MTRSIYEVAGSIAERAGWTLSNLSLQKLVYLTQMAHLGKYGQPLFNEDFEAWDYGPVVPDLYHQLKMFGAEPVQSYSRLRPLHDLTPKEAEVIDMAADIGTRNRPARLVAFTHQPDGAWAQVYGSGARGAPISKDLIRQEYLHHARQAA